MKKLLIIAAAIMLAACGSTPQKPASSAASAYDYEQDFNNIQATRIAFTEFTDERDAIILDLSRNKLDKGQKSDAKTWLATKDIAAIIEKAVKANLEQNGILDNASNLVLSGKLIDVQNQSVEGAAPGAFYLSVTTVFKLENSGEEVWSQEIKAGSIVKEEDMKRSIDDAFAKSLNNLVGDLLMDDAFLQTLDQ